MKRGCLLVLSFVCTTFLSEQLAHGNPTPAFTVPSLVKKWVKNNIKDAQVSFLVNKLPTKAVYLTPTAKVPTPGGNDETLKPTFKPTERSPENHNEEREKLKCLENPRGGCNMEDAEQKLEDLEGTLPENPHNPVPKGVEPPEEGSPGHLPEGEEHEHKHAGLLGLADAGLGIVANRANSDFIKLEAKEGQIALKGYMFILDPIGNLVALGLNALLFIITHGGVSVYSFIGVN